MQTNQLKKAQEYVENDFKEFSITTIFMMNNQWRRVYDAYNGAKEFKEQEPELQLSIAKLLGFKEKEGEGNE